MDIRLKLILGAMSFAVLFGIVMGVHDLYTRKRHAETYDRVFRKAERRHRDKYRGK